jgi:hypothetical protein
MILTRRGGWLQRQSSRCGLRVFQKCHRHWWVLRRRPPEKWWGGSTNRSERLQLIRVDWAEVVVVCKCGCQSIKFGRRWDRRTRNTISQDCEAQFGILSRAPDPVAKRALFIKDAALLLWLSVPH